MELSIQILFLLSALGVFNGIILCAYFLVFKAEKNKADIWLGLMLLALTTRIGKSVLYYFNDDLPKWVLQVGLTACLYIGPFFYYYIRTSLKQDHKKGLSIKTQLIGLVLLGGVGLFITYENDPWFWNYVAVKVIYAVWMIYVLLGIYVSRSLWDKNIQKDHKKQWLKALIIANVIICLVYHSMLYFGFPTYITGPISFSFLFYVLIGFLLFSPWRKSILNIEQQQTQTPKKKLGQEVILKLNQSLEYAMNTGKVYLDPKLKLEMLAEQIDTTPHILSQFLNDHIGKNFNSYINDLRVEAAAKLISTDHNYSYAGIATEVGFRSKSTFYNAFKARYQMTPKAYAESLNS